MYILLKSKAKNKYLIRLKEKLTGPFYRGKRTQVKIDYRGSHLSNKFGHDNFSKLDSPPLFRKTNQVTYIDVS